MKLFKLSSKMLKPNVVTYFPTTYSSCNIKSFFFKKNLSDYDRLSVQQKNHVLKGNFLKVVKCLADNRGKAACKHLWKSKAKFNLTHEF